MKLTIIILLIIILIYFKFFYKNGVNKNGIDKNIGNKLNIIEDFNIYCNKKNEENYDFFSKKTIINNHLNKVNTSKIPKYIYTSKSLIPFNYSDNMDNNLIYSLNLKKKDKIMRLEKINYGKQFPFNSKLLTKNFNNNLDQFLVENEVPVAYRYKGCKKIPNYEGEVCSIDKIIISLLGRYKKYKLHINWNLPTNCIDFNEFYLFYKRHNQSDNKYKLLKINYNNKTEEILFNQGKLIVYKDFNHLKYNFFFEKPTKYTCFIYLKMNEIENYSNIFE